MARNSSGTYSLPAGNPVTTGTTISSTIQNNTTSDIATELTDSLSRSGKGPMLAPFEATDGTAAAPSITFDTDTDCGLYRVGANSVGFSIAGTKVLGVSAANLTVTGAAVVTGGAVLTQSTSDVYGLTVTGNGTGAGVLATGGSTSVGVSGAGGGTTAGGTFANGTAATGAAPQNALILSNGYLSLASVTNPNSTVGFANILTTMNIPKAWASVDITGATFTPTVNAGFNIASVSRQSATVVRIVFGTALANANFCVTTASNTAGSVYVSARNTAYVELAPDAGTLDGLSGVKIFVVVFGAQ